MNSQTVVDGIDSALDEVTSDLNLDLSLNTVDYHRWLAKIKIDRDILNHFSCGSKRFKIHLARSLTKKKKSLTNTLVKILNDSMDSKQRSAKVKKIKINQLVKSIDSAFQGLVKDNKDAYSQFSSKVKTNILKTVEYFKHQIRLQFDIIKNDRLGIEEFKAQKKEIELLKYENQILLEENSEKQELINAISKKLASFQHDSIIVTIENLDTYFEVLYAQQNQIDSEIKRLEALKVEMNLEIDKTTQIQNAMLHKFDLLQESVKTENDKLSGINKEVTIKSKELEDLRSQLNKTNAEKEFYKKEYDYSKTQVRLGAGEIRIFDMFKAKVQKFHKYYRRFGLDKSKIKTAKDKTDHNDMLSLKEMIALDLETSLEEEYKFFKYYEFIKKDHGQITFIFNQAKYRVAPSDNFFNKKFSEISERYK